MHAVSILSSGQSFTVAQAVTYRFPTSWEQVRSAFLGHFYTKAKTAALRNKISSFKQLADEPFNEDWERFNDTLRECPHHGFDDDHVLGIFYDGVEWEFRNALNAASNGDFMTQERVHLSSC